MSAVVDAEYDRIDFTLRLQSGRINDLLRTLLSNSEVSEDWLKETTHWIVLSPRNPRGEQVDLLEEFVKVMKEWAEDHIVVSNDYERTIKFVEKLREHRKFLHQMVCNT